MRPNLSLENIAAALAVLGTAAVLTACTKAEKSAPASAAPATNIKSDTPVSQGAATATAAAPIEGKPEAPLASASAAPAASDKALKRRPGSGTGGQASCGNGNCSAEMKKK